MKLVTRLMVAGSVFAGMAARASAAPVGVHHQDERKDVVAEEIIIRRGVSMHEFKLNETITAPSLTVWFEKSPACQGFGLQKLEVLSGEEWIQAPEMKYGENHFYRTENIEISGLRFAAIQNLRARMRCHIHVIAEDTQLPQLLTILARVSFVDCSGEEESQTQCKVQLQRLDEEAAAPMVVEQTSAAGAKLENQKIYRLEGYIEANRETGAEEFHINESELVMP